MKTITQAAREYAGRREDGARSEFGAFVDGARFAQRWIPVEEELPENFKVVLVKDVKCRVFTAKITPDGWVDQQRLKYCQYRINCWRHVELK
jgi:hypothetical protein